MVIFIELRTPSPGPAGMGAAGGPFGPGGPFGAEGGQAHPKPPNPEPSTLGSEPANFGLPVTFGVDAAGGAGADRICFRERVHNVFWQKSIPAQIHRLILYVSNDTG